MTVYTVSMKECVNWSYSVARQIFPFVFLKVFLLVTLLGKMSTLLLRKMFTLLLCCLKKKRVTSPWSFNSGRSEGYLGWICVLEKTWSSINFEAGWFLESFSTLFPCPAPVTTIMWERGNSELLAVSAGKCFAVGLVHTFFKQRPQMEEYNILGQMWLNMYGWLNVLNSSTDNVDGHRFQYLLQCLACCRYLKVFFNLANCCATKETQEALRFTWRLLDYSVQSRVKAFHRLRCLQTGNREVAPCGDWKKIPNLVSMLGIHSDALKNGLFHCYPIFFLFLHV